MEPPVANCFREISEFDDPARRGPPMEAAEEKMLMPDVHSAINISLSQACRK